MSIFLDPFAYMFLGMLSGYMVAVVMIALLFFGHSRMTYIRSESKESNEGLKLSQMHHEYLHVKPVPMRSGTHRMSVTGMSPKMKMKDLTPSTRAGGSIASLGNLDDYLELNQVHSH